MAFDRRLNITEINDEERIVYFDYYKLKKISGTKLGAVLGVSPFATPFKVACEIGGIYYEVLDTKYIEAGNVIEPILRDYLEHSVTRLLKARLGLSDEDVVAIEPPGEKENCGYDHFHDERLFGGLVDGYVLVNGRRDSVLEIKTSHSREGWLDEDGNISRVPVSYMLQASLYAELSHLDRIVFLVGFLEDEDYAHPAKWIPNHDNTYMVVVDKFPDIREKMAEAEKWYNKYVKCGCTPEWTDADTELVEYLKKGYKARR